MSEFCFKRRSTTDIYPADFGWTPDYRKPGERLDWWYHNLSSVSGAGVAEITNQLENDDEVAFQGEAELYRLARKTESQHWCLTVTFRSAERRVGKECVSTVRSRGLPYL